MCSYVSSPHGNCIKCGSAIPVSGVMIELLKDNQCKIVEKAELLMFDLLIYFFLKK